MIESGCTDPVNIYESSGDSSLTVLSTHECTNHDPAPECPVELNAFGWHWGSDTKESMNWTTWVRSEFELTVDSAASRIVVDGNTFSINRDPASADRNSPPTGPPAYRAWKLV